MAARNWTASLAAIISEEGGFADNPGDPGGATNMGITRATLAAFRGRSVSREDVLMLEKAEAAQIYRTLYWQAIGADDLPSGLDLALFDDAVNSGPHAAIGDLQRALQVYPDGVIGPQTRTALASQPLASVIAALCAARLARLKTLPHFSLFGRGWTRRIQRIARAAKALASQEPGLTPVQPAARSAATTKGKSMAETDTIETKPFWASQTIWSSVAVIGSSVTGALLAWKGNDIAGFGAALTALLGGVNAIVGRVRAKSAIG